MLEPRRLTTLWTFEACYRVDLPFFYINRKNTNYFRFRIQNCGVRDIEEGERRRREGKHEGEENYTGREIKDKKKMEE
jgi:hypothetical protein